MQKSLDAKRSLGTLMIFMVLAVSSRTSVLFFSQFARYSVLVSTVLSGSSLQTALNSTINLHGLLPTHPDLDVNKFKRCYRQPKHVNDARISETLRTRSFMEPPTEEHYIKTMTSDNEATSSKALVSPDSDDEISIVYDKRDSQGKDQCQMDRTRDDYTADQYVVRLEDIPLPPMSWLPHKKNIVNSATKECVAQLKTSSATGFSTEVDIESTLKSSDNSCKDPIFSRQSTSSFQYEDLREEVETMKKEVGDFRRWDHIDSFVSRDATVQNKTKNPGVFTIMSYNVLAQELLETHQYLYQNHDHRSLSWNRRKGILFREIQEIYPDILCLQEVQHNHLDSFRSHLLDQGYTLGLYKRRTNGKADGCALFYKNSKFVLVESTTVEYYQPSMSILDRDNVAIIARLQLRGMEDDEYQVVVATTHLLYNPRRHDIKLAQTQMLLAEVERMAFIGFNPVTKASKYWPVIITGDFNAKPDSAVYKFLTEGFLQYSNLAARTLSEPAYGQAHQDILLPPELQISSKSQHLNLIHKRDLFRHSSESRGRKEIRLLKIFNSDHHKSVSHFLQRLSTNNINFDEWESGYVSHGFNLKSVYPHQQIAPNGRRVQYEATTYQKEWVTVDYIFYSGRSNNERLHHMTKGSLKLLSRYTLPTRDVCHKLQHLPNLLCGSDHLPLAAQFLLTSDPK